MKKILINFAHPANNRSHINKALKEAIQDLEHVTINDLYSNYPDFLIDIQREQALCESHDVIVFQHPFYWYSTPSIIKEWCDLVLEHDWAYGVQANALKDKLFLQALSAGADEDTYHKEGYNKFTIEMLTSPLQATANLCKMIWLPPFAIFGVHKGLPQSQINVYASEYKKLIQALRGETLDIQKCSEYKYINESLNNLVEKES